MLPEVANYIDQLPSKLQPLAESLRREILHALPQAEEAFKWKVPYYSCYGPICYLNRVDNDMVVGFMRGSKMADPYLKFVAKDRKLIRHLPFSPHEPLDKEMLYTYLWEALAYNQSLQK